VAAVSAAEEPQHLPGLEELARSTLRRIERRRFELLGLTLLVLVAFAASLALVAFGEAIPMFGEFEAAMTALRFSLIPLALGFAVYLIDKERQLRRTTREVYTLEEQATARLKLLYDMKDALLTAVSHEVRTPLTKALGYARTLEQIGDRLTDERRQEFASGLAASLSALERLLGDLMDVDRLWRQAVDLTRRPTDVGALARRVVDGFDWGEPRSVTVEADDVSGDVDAAKVERILETLLANARRHTPAGTAVWIRAVQDDGGVVMAVEDAGPGVPAELRELLFRPFEHGPTAQAHSPGTGIGLTLVERLAELHGGRAWVEDRPGGGASFQVFLPDADPVRPEGASLEARPLDRQSSV
jgi:signal transduction histidine kinase